MKVLMISLDGSILEKDSKSASRMKDYGSICGELHIIVLGIGGENLKLTDNIYIYPAGGSRFLSLFKAKQIGEKILSKRNDWIITAQDPFETGFIGWRLAKKFGVGLEVQLHGDFYGNNYWRKEKTLNQLRYYLGKFILKQAGAVRAVSERIKKSIENLTKAKINKIPIQAEFKIGGANPIFLKNRFPDSYPILFAVGNLAPVKNYQLLIEVFAEIKKELPKIKLIIAGEGPLLENFKFQISNFKLENDVELAGYQDNLADYYKSADIFAHPSFYEGWGRVVAEAAYCGLPIIMSDVGLAGEVIKNGESGLIVPVNNREALKAAILRLAKDKELQKKLAENAKIAVGKLSTRADFLAAIKESWENCLKSKLII